MNHADFGSRGGTKIQLEKEHWWAGPHWIQNKEQWPKTERHSKTDFESIQKELKNGEKLFYCADEKKDETEIDKLLERKTPKGTKRIIAWFERSIFNCKAKRNWVKDKLWAFIYRRD